MIKQTIAPNKYKSPILTRLSQLHHFFIDKKGLLFDENKQPIKNDDGIQISLGKLKK